MVSKHFHGSPIVHFIKSYELYINFKGFLTEDMVLQNVCAFSSKQLFPCSHVDLNAICFKGRISSDFLLENLPCYKILIYIIFLLYTCFI